MLRWIIQTNGSSEHFALEKTGYSIKHQLTESQKYVDENGNIDDTYLDALCKRSIACTLTNISR